MSWLSALKKRVGFERDVNADDVVRFLGPLSLLRANARGPSALPLTAAVRLDYPARDAAEAEPQGRVAVSLLQGVCTSITGRAVPCNEHFPVDGR